MPEKDDVDFGTGVVFLVQEVKYILTYDHISYIPYIFFKLITGV